MYFQNKLISVLFFACLAIQLTAQTKLNFNMKVGSFFGETDVENRSGHFKINEESHKSTNGSISLAFSLPIKGKFRLGAEIGHNFYETLLDANASPVHNYLGYYQINQAYFAFVPEFRILDFLYIQAGTGFFKDYNSNYTSGIGIRTEPFETFDLTGMSQGRVNSYGYFLGVGLCPNITKEFAMLLDVRWLNCPAATDSPEQVGIGFAGTIVNLGFAYKPKS